MKTITNVPMQSGLKYANEDAVVASKSLQDSISEISKQRDRRISDAKRSEDTRIIESLKRELNALPKILDEFCAEYAVSSLSTEIEEHQQTFRNCVGKLPYRGYEYLISYGDNMIKSGIIADYLIEIRDAIAHHRKCLPQVSLYIILDNIEKLYRKKFQYDLVSKTHSMGGNSNPFRNMENQYKVEVISQFCREGIFGYWPVFTDIRNNLVKFGLIDDISDAEYEATIKAASQQ